VNDTLKQGLAWFVIAGCVLAWVLAKRRGENRFAAAVAKAHAEGYAEGGQAVAMQHVQVAVDASHRGGASSGDVDLRAAVLDPEDVCVDPLVCERCGPGARVILRQVLDGLARPADRELASLAIGHAVVPDPRGRGL